MPDVVANVQGTIGEYFVSRECVCPPSAWDSLERNEYEMEVYVLASRCRPARPVLSASLLELYRIVMVFMHSTATST